ncbi:MAG: aminotransferase class I/II-fold pyridoxal phosphate-dependent enzyme [Bacteroidota bacterium]
MSAFTARRLERLEEYYFSRKLEEIRHLRSKGHDVINLGIGSPDLPPSPAVTAALSAAAQDPTAHAYQSYRGLPEFRSAISSFYQDRYDVRLDSETEILPLMGSKEGITHISLAYLNAGDQVLIPELGYPTYTSVTRMAEAEPVYFPLDPTNHWAPDWEFLEGLDTQRIKLMWINYPHMPTGQRGNLDLLSRYVRYAADRDILLCHDNPYSFILNPSPLSIFQVSGASDVAMELNSLSKTFNMAGWRVGWLCGSADKVDAVLKVKSNMDSGMFKPIQVAAIKALSLGRDWYESLDRTYRDRRAQACTLLDLINCEYSEDQSGMFIWARVADGKTAESLSDELLHTCHVFVTPGFIFGPAGNDYVRISLCSPQETFEAAIGRINSSL